MTLLQAENVKKSYGERVLFENLSFSISEGQKIALIARNGAGKTSLMRILAGLESSEGGKVSLTRSVRMGYLPQEPVLNPDLNVLDAVLQGENPQVKALHDYEQALLQLAEANTEASQRLLQNATNQMDTLQAWDFERQVRTMLSKLELDDLKAMVGKLSGGQRKRVALAQILLSQPDLLLLDEPTNHLDVGMVEWLEDYLSRSRLALLLVTHDRYFLDRVANEILELEYGQLFRYPGSYAAYLEGREARELNAQAETEKARNLLRKELEWMRRQPKARTTKARYRIDAFYDLQDKAQGRSGPDGVQLGVQMSRLGKKILLCHKISKAFGEKVILDKFSYAFQRGERIGIAGPNGVGKTTFLEVLTGATPPDSGELETGETVVFGYYRQAGLKLPEDKRVIEVVTDIAEVIPAGKNETLTASQLLERFGFPPPQQHTFVSRLSGGERRRLYLLTILARQPNFLILDEPTNDLDIPTLQTLEAFLLDFPGCLLIVSHDRFFMDKLSQHLFVFEGQGKVRDFNGSYSDYREHLQAEEDEKAQQTAAAKQTPPALKPAAEEKPKKKLSYKEQRELDGLEGEIEKLESRKAELAALLSAGQGSGEDFAKWGAELQQVEAALDEKMLRWMELSE